MTAPVLPRWVAELARKYPRLANKPVRERRIAIVLGIGPDGGIEDPEAAAVAIEVLREAGYRTGELPGEANLLVARLRGLPSGVHPRGPAQERLAFSDYSMLFAGLAPDVQRRVAERWGAAERDPLFRPGRLDCGAFAIPALREGNIAVLLQPSGGHRLALDGPCVEDGPAPPHSHIALCGWLNDEFRADALLVLRNGRGRHRPDGREMNSF